ncbi:MFS transporter [Microbispora bryophytorum]|uniref:MFS transporter n=1 Tax=Microbispora bryophytorum subsp. camponoti TaxID=1677852 RepID=A0ABR8LDP7_9ACTN|nr:MFS transporter [Microbispora camponoti]MBD3147919.1 MFS transporter [Microbispora camponoti]
MPSFLTDRSRNVAAFAVLGGAQVTLVAAITLLTVPLPAVQREFGLGQGDLALLTSAYGLTFGGLLLLGGRLADRWGAREVFLAGMALLALASAAGGLAPDHVVLLAARFVQGVGAALAAPAAVSLVTRLRPDVRERERALAVWGTLSVTGAVAGSLLSGLVAAVTSWRWSFLLPAAVGVAAVAAGAFLLPPAPRTAARLDVPGALLATAGLVALAYGLLEGATAVAATGLLLAAGFIVLQARTPHPLLPLRLVAHRRRGAALLVVFVTAAASATTTFLLSLYMQQVRGLSPISTSLAFLPFLLVVVMGPLSGRLLRRFGVRPVLVAGLLLAAVSMLLLGRVASEGSVLAGLLVFPVASGLAFSGATVAALDGMRAEDAGAAGALVNTAMEAGPTVGLAVLVALAAARAGGMPAGGARAMTEGYGFALTAMAPVFLLAAATVAVAFTRTAFTPTAAGRTAFAQTKER